MDIRKLLAISILAIGLVFGVGATPVLGETTTNEVIAPYEVPPDDYFVMDASRYADLFSFVRVVTIGVAEGIYPELVRGEVQWKKREVMFQQLGSGFVVKDGYVFTAAHVVIPQVVHTPAGASSIWVTEPLRVLRQEVLIYDFKSEPTIAKIFYTEVERDVAILKYIPNQSLRPMPYQTYGKPITLEVGSKVAAVVHVRNDDDNLTSDLKVIYGSLVCDGVCMMPPEAAPWFNVWDYTLMLPIIPGDSGSPLFMRNPLNGEPVCVGVIRAASFDPFTGFYAYAVRFDRLLRLIDLREQNE